MVANLATGRETSAFTFSEGPFITDSTSYLTDYEDPDPNVGAPVFDEQVRNEATKHGSKGTTNQRNPRHKVTDLSIGEILSLEEQLRVVGPDVPAGVPHAPGYAEQEHAGVEERFDEE